LTAGNVAHLLAAIELLGTHLLDRTGSGGKLEAVGAAVAILRALIAAMLGIVAPVDTLEELEVGAAYRAVEVMVRVRYTLHGDGNGGGSGSGLRSGGLHGLRGLHGCLVLSFYYFSLPIAMAFFSFNFSI
jgi:hypothetical protein